jgi:hypothetical protein
MSWNREGQVVAGIYLKSHPVIGTVENSRVKYGGSVQHTVVLSQPIEVFGTLRDRLLLDEEDLLTAPRQGEYMGDTPASPRVIVIA